MQQETVVPHPVGQVVGHPRTPLGPIVVGTGRADSGGELVLPMDAFRTIGNVEPVRNAKPRVGVDLFPGQLVGPDIEPAPALGIGNEAGHSHGPLDHGRQFVADGQVLDACGSRVLLRGLRGRSAAVGVVVRLDEERSSDLITEFVIGKAMSFFY